MSLFDWFLAIAPDSMQPDLDSPLKNKKWVEILMSNFNGYENKKRAIFNLCFGLYKLILWLLAYHNKIFHVGRLYALHTSAKLLFSSSPFHHMVGINGKNSEDMVTHQTRDVVCFLLRSSSLSEELALSHTPLNF